MDIVPVGEVPRLPRRASDGHKGTYGTVLVIAGNRGTAGAAVLAGRAALRAGAGLVRVACPLSIQDVVAAGNPCYTTVGIPKHADGSFGDGAAVEIGEHARAADAVAMGPGLGQGAGVARFVQTLLDQLKDVPVILDADGLNAVAPFDAKLVGRTAAVVMTPHPGEFSRLTGHTVAEVNARRDFFAAEFARSAGAIVLLKGDQTVVTDGTRVYRNPTGNAGMATGGSGDVLTGVIAALIGQGLDAFDAAVLGAWAHGRAGDDAAARHGQTALIATDIIDALPTAFRELEAGW